MKMDRPKNRRNVLHFRAALVLSASLLAPQAEAQFSNLPPDLQKTLGEISRTVKADPRAGVAATLSAFRPILSGAPKDGVAVSLDQPYGPDPKQVVDVYRPPVGTRAPILIFVHGGAYVYGDKNPDAEIYANIGFWFAAKGIVTLNTNYRLAPDVIWPSATEDLRDVVAWARENAPRFGGDPDRIYLMGHSAGATHVAGYVFDRSLQPPGGPGVAGAVLISGRYRLIYDPADPNASYMQAYFGTDPAQYPVRSPINHVADGRKIPVFLVIAEFENPGLDLRGAEMLTAVCERDRACPRFMRLIGHNHLSEVAAFNTPDELLGRETLDFIRKGR